MISEIPQSYHILIDDYKTHHCDSEHCVKIASVAKLPSRFGDFLAVAFHQIADNKEHIAIVKGDVVGKENVLVRVHSECLTGDALGSLRCDCREQLEGGLQKIESEGSGVLLYLRQEGRGIGLTNKIKAYELQDAGLNTVEANLALGFEDDQRDYHIAKHMLQTLQINSIRLLTNNPRKINALGDFGLNIVDRVEHIYEPNIHNAFYLETKRVLANHMI